MESDSFPQRHEGTSSHYVLEKQIGGLTAAVCCVCQQQSLASLWDAFEIHNKGEKGSPVFRTDHLGKDIKALSLLKQKTNAFIFF